jgi:hypothetical protein
MIKFKMGFWGWLLDISKSKSKMENYCFDKWGYYARKFYKLESKKETK